MPVNKQQQPMGIILTDCAATRNLNIIYRNTTGQPVLVMLTVGCLTTLAATNAEITAQIGPATPPPLFIGHAGIIVSPAAANHSERFPIAFIVPQNYYYRVVSVAGAGANVTLLTWFEATLVAPYGAGI